MANSTRKCCGCKERYQALIMRKFNAGWFCSDECAVEYSMNKVKKQREADRKLKIRELKKQATPLPKLKKAAEKAVHAYIRLRDGNTCISCGETKEQKYGGSIDAGHFLARGSAAYRHLSFNTFNIHSQCKYCNQYLGGNQLEFEKGLAAKIGKERVDRLKNDRFGEYPSRERLERIAKVFRARTRHLNKLRDNMCGDRWLKTGSPWKKTK